MIELEVIHSGYEGPKSEKIENCQKINKFLSSKLIFNYLYI